MTEKVEFHGAINKVSTLADLGIRVVFDLSEDAVMQAAQLMAIRQAGMSVKVVVTPVESGN